MPRSDKQKLKLLYIKDYLEKNSHQNRLVRAAELCEMLQAHGISCDRKTALADIRALKEYGVDILSVPGRNGGHYVASRNFDLPELKLLIDAVQSSRYLTEKKSRELITKLCSYCNKDDASFLQREVLISGRVKSMNESIYYNVDAIQEAIAQNRQIVFRYFDWNLRGEREYRQRGYRASPYGLCQDNENYYLLAWSGRHGVTSYRVDRMAEIQLAQEERIPCPELAGPSLQRHANKLFQMYAGESVSVKLRFHRDLINTVIDRFGKNVLLIPAGPEYFTVTVEVAVSPMFLSWVIGFGKKAQILYPQSVANQCAALCLEAMAQYQATQKD